MRRDPSPARLRRRLADLAQFAIDALDALDLASMDREDDDPAEDGGDIEPSLGATFALDQRLAWAATSFIFDGEASGTVEDLETYKSDATRRADRLAARDARLRLLAQRQTRLNPKRSAFR